MADRRGLSLNMDILFGDWKEDFQAHSDTIAFVATAAMDSAVNVAKVDGRVDIAAAGFSKRWQNALRGQRYPERKSRVSIDAAGLIYHNIQYAGVFEDGAHIMGTPMLWLPLPGTPKRVGKDKMTPALYVEKVGPLTSLRSRNGTPLLGTPVRLSATKAAMPQPRVTLSSLRKGAATLGPSGRKRSGVVRLIPLFFGIKAVDIPKKINIREICRKARDRLPAFYAQHFPKE